MNKLNSIQILRAVAVLVVVLFHSHFVVPSFSEEYKFQLPFISTYGYFGVDLFFVISGFIIAHITSGKIFNVKKFLMKRFLRIYIIYAIFCLLSFYLFKTSNLYFGPKPEDFTVLNLLASLVIFPLQGSPAYGVGWSLEHEIIFYLTTAIVLYFGQLRHLYWVIGSLALFGMFLDVQVRIGNMDKFWDYHLLSPVNFCFFLGLLIHRYKIKVQSFGFFLPFILSIILMAGALYLMGSNSATGLVIGRYIAVALSCGMLMIGFLNYGYGCREGGETADKWLYKFLVLIGSSSYSLYLVHWIILINFGRIKYRSFIGVPDEFAELWRYSFIGISICVAIGMFYLLERPLAIVANKLSDRISKNVYP